MRTQYRRQNNKLPVRHWQTTTPFLFCFFFFLILSSHKWHHLNEIERERERVWEHQHRRVCSEIFFFVLAQNPHSPHHTLAPTHEREHIKIKAEIGRRRRWWCGVGNDIERERERKKEKQSRIVINYRSRSSFKCGLLSSSSSSLTMQCLLTILLHFRARLRHWVKFWFLCRRQQQKQKKQKRNFVAF